MALFNKIFFSSTNKKKTFGSNQSQQQYLSQFPFDLSQVRILLYRECDIRGRRLLFDSNAIEKIDLKGQVNNTEFSGCPANGVPPKKETTSTKASNGFIQISNGYGYKHSRPNTGDISNIGEMIFGALAMSFRGTSLKVHWLESPARVLCSQVFLSPVHNQGHLSPSNISLTSSCTQNDLPNTTIDNVSMNSFSMPFSVSINTNLITEKVETTNPLDVPSSENNITRNSRVYHTYSGGDSGYCGTDQWTASSSSYCQYSTRSSLGSVFSDHDSFRKLSIDSSSLIGDNSLLSSDNSLQRRISRNVSTSLENKNSISDFIGFIDDNYQTATIGGSDGCVIRYPQRRHSDVNESRSNPEITRRRGASGDTFIQYNNNNGHSNRHGRKRAKLGLAVYITMTENYEKEMEEFCCEHIALLEAMLCRLRASSENAYMNHKDFLQIMLNAWQSTTQWINDLFTAPRLPCPIWLTLTSETSKDAKNLADVFIQELCWLLSFADTKDTNFFISTMLTAILTHHLGWVSTITTFNTKSNSQTTNCLNEQKAKILEISKKHPYNALWAQMGDLYGAVGFPPKISRTIIYGSEKRSIDKVLNVLTYFIRCGEIKKCPKSAVFDKTSINLILNSDNSMEKISEINTKVTSKTTGLTRSPTCRKNLSSVNLNEMIDNKSITYNSTGDFKKNIMNDIPNVLAFRDSRFIQQELRVGNHQMDTGIEMNTEPINEELYHVKDKIQLIVTTPDNVQVKVVDGQADKTSQNNNLNTSSGSSFWKRDYQEGSSSKIVQEFPKDIEIINNDRNFDDNKTNLQRSKSFLTNSDKILSKKQSNQNEYNRLKNNNYKSHATSLSDLITENSVGKNERLTWGIEPTKEIISSEEIEHFEVNKKIVEKQVELRKDNGVLFVLGDNEALVNLKRSTEDIQKINPTKIQTINQTATAEPRRMCNHHKKHSGVKFNFEQYPQIATNYMKNKNLDLTNYDFLEKSAKLEGILDYESSTCAFPINLTKSEETPSNSECEYCSGTDTRILQTPSNATELEFETNDNYPISTTSTSKLCDSTIRLSKINTTLEPNKSESNETLSDLKIDFEDDSKNQINIIYLPIPDTKEHNEKPKTYIKSGFIPSLLVGISDHYISDMVLQGTIASPHLWEINLRQDLALSAHCASVIPAPTENIAVIADLDKWDVKVISSQTYVLPYINGTNGPVGMSQLVSSMLETVHAMSTSGISAFECISYIESKLQEMYLQSESLAAFLLATEFCSLNTVTSALNLTENDVPLLLSVASIHSPQVTRKYGVSFR